MDIYSAFPYVSGVKPTNPGPLARFMPLLEDGTVAAWLSDHIQPGEWVLDPFNSAPRLAIEAARAGYRVLVTANNPVTRFLLEMAANPPDESTLKAALADLASSRRGGERLEAHLQCIYGTECAKCAHEIPAQVFLWRRKADVPFAHIYHCEYCGDEGERLSTQVDTERAAKVAAMAGMHRARILERVASLDDPDREYAEEALHHYPPRAIYALGTLINRLDGLSLSAERRRHLTALLLTACDQANMLWPYPTERPRPRALTMPGAYYEYNVWLALEESIKIWASSMPPVPCVLWPQKLPESGGICLFEGRLKDLVPQVKEAPIRAVIGALPRPNQAFWTLSALWAGWLWGRQASAPFKSVLRRRRYDWDWHALALQAAFRHLFDILSPGVSFFNLLAEPEPSFLSAAQAAAFASGFDLQGIALRTAHDPVQMVWQRREQFKRGETEFDTSQLHVELQNYLRARGEPATYLHLHVIALAVLAEERALVHPRQSMDKSLGQIQAVIQQALAENDHLTHYAASGHGLEAGLWGLKITEVGGESLADRIEVAVLRLLQRNSNCTSLILEGELYSQFPGLITPSQALVQAVLDSYAIQEDGRWRLRDEDKPDARRAELEVMTNLIEALGQRLDYTVRRSGSNLLLWEKNGDQVHAFYLLASAIVGRILAENPYPSERSLIVLPGGRAGLLAYKFRRDPTLHPRALGWRFLKFRLLRALADIPLLTRQTWEEQITSDPIEQLPGQMMMF